MATQHPPFTPKTLAARWGCSERHVRHLIEQELLPHFRVGNLIRIPFDIVKAHEECTTTYQNPMKSASESSGAIGPQSGVAPNEAPKDGPSGSRLPLIAAKPSGHLKITSVPSSSRGD